LSETFAVPKSLIDFAGIKFTDGKNLISTIDFEKNQEISKFSSKIILYFQNHFGFE